MRMLCLASLVSITALPIFGAVHLDREAIQGMAGCYSVDFSFREVESLQEGYEVREDPYHAAAVEQIVFTELAEGVFELQHILRIGEAGYLKHWRQVWRPNPSTTLSYTGSDTWEFRSQEQSDSVRWGQEIYQVADSPRYGCAAEWTHEESGSSWQCETLAPLPRREYTQRSDYHVLRRHNTHELTEDGWVHRQDNVKLILAEDGELVPLAREEGLNRYIRVDDAACGEAASYWTGIEPVWRVIQDSWQSFFNPSQPLTLRKTVRGQVLWMHMFQLAGQYYPRIPLERADEDTLAAEASAIISSFQILP